jgi:hypothetical protein
MPQGFNIGPWRGLSGADQIYTLLGGGYWSYGAMGRMMEFRGRKRTVRGFVLPAHIPTPFAKHSVQERKRILATDRKNYRKRLIFIDER